MSQGSLPSDWLNRFVDPYAVLGIAVTADDRRVLKRYRNVARLLHPDSLVSSDAATQQLATQIFAKVVNPAYEKLKQEKNRKENSALLRLRVRQLTREGPLSPKSDQAQQLMKHPAAGVDIFYEQAVAELAERQYEPLSQFELITHQLGELNLVYLQLKMGEVFVSREKRTGLVAAAAPEARPLQFTPARPGAEVSTESYDRRHYRRAQEYMKKGNWEQAIQELRDAIKIEAAQADYHALLGIAFIKRSQTGDGAMARAYLKRALQINPKHELAVKYAPVVGITASDIANPVPPGQAQSNKAANPSGGQQNGKSGDQNGKSAPNKPEKNGGLFGIFRSKH